MLPSLDGWLSAFIILVGVSMLLAPLWILNAQWNFQNKLVIITVIIGLFLLVLSYVMASKPFEALISPAGRRKSRLIARHVCPFSSGKISLLRQWIWLKMRVAGA